MEKLRASSDPSGSTGCAFLGGIVPGGDETPFQWISTEHNADMLAFLRRLQVVSISDADRAKWAECADALEPWMLTPVFQGGLWVDDAPGHFAVGYESVNPPIVSSFPEVTDSQTWTPLAFGASGRVTGDPIRSDRIGLDWLDENWLISVDRCGEARRGFSKRSFAPSDPTSPIQSYWTEGTAGYALARLVAPDPSPVGLTWGSVVADIRCFQQFDGGVLYTVAAEPLDFGEYFEAGDAPLAVFSNFNNLFGGEPGVFGDADPDWAHRATHLVSWFYSESEVAGSFDPRFIRSPLQSFALVNDSDRTDRYPLKPGEKGGWNPGRTAWKPHGWASMAFSLMPDDEQSRDLSSYTHLNSWVRAESPGVYFRVIGRLKGVSGDRVWPPRSHPALEAPSDDWTQIEVPLASLLGANRAEAVSVGFSFGNNEGNANRATFWIDDLSFRPTLEPFPEPKEWPTNWAWESVASTSWLIFAELRFNPFALVPVPEPSAPFQLAVGVGVLMLLRRVSRRG
jgi:hypothetical protein